MTNLSMVAHKSKAVKTPSYDRTKFGNNPEGRMQYLANRVLTELQQAHPNIVTKFDIHLQTNMYLADITHALRYLKTYTDLSGHAVVLIPFKGILLTDDPFLIDKDLMRRSREREAKNKIDFFNQRQALIELITDATTREQMRGELTALWELAQELDRRIAS